MGGGGRGGGAVVKTYLAPHNVAIVTVQVLSNQTVGKPNRIVSVWLGLCFLDLRVQAVTCATVPTLVTAATGASGASTKMTTTCSVTL